MLFKDPDPMQGGRVLEQGTHDELMAHSNGAYTQLVHHRQQEPEEAPAAAADDDILLAPEPDEETYAGKAAARRSMAIRSSMVAGRKSMAPGRKSMAPGRKDMSAARKRMAPGRQSVAPAGRKSVFPGRFLLSALHALHACLTAGSSMLRHAVKHACLQISFSGSTGLSCAKVNRCTGKAVCEACADLMTAEAYILEQYSHWDW